MSRCRCARPGLPPMRSASSWTDRRRSTSSSTNATTCGLKVLLREVARSRGLPVLMATSDRGMMDVERFDLEPGRPLFHGLVGDVAAADIPLKPSMEEKVKLVTAIVGLDTLSARIGASMLEIGETITTWPQLGSDVTLGGAAMTVAVRRLALGQSLPSGRRYLDMEQVLTAELPIAVGRPKRTRVAEPVAEPGGRPHSRVRALRRLPGSPGAVGRQLPAMAFCLGRRPSPGSSTIGRARRISRWMGNADRLRRPRCGDREHPDRGGAAWVLHLDRAVSVSRRPGRRRGADVRPR